MSAPDQAERLIRSLRFTTNLLRQLEQGLRQRRTAWISARPSELEAPATDLEALANELRAEEQRRGELIAGLEQLLPLPGALPGRELKITVSLIAPHLPAPLGHRLRAAAAEATAAAAAVRTETALGGRLLDFSRRAHDSWLRGVAAEQHAPTAYDRNARRIGGAGAGNLVDGRL